MWSGDSWGVEISPPDLSASTAGGPECIRRGAKSAIVPTSGGSWQGVRRLDCTCSMTLMLRDEGTEDRLLDCFPGLLFERIFRNFAPANLISFSSPRSIIFLGKAKENYNAPTFNFFTFLLFQFYFSERSS